MKPNDCVNTDQPNFPHTQHQQQQQLKQRHHPRDINNNDNRCFNASNQQLDIHSVNNHNDDAVAAAGSKRVCELVVVSVVVVIILDWRAFVIVVSCCPWHRVRSGALPGSLALAMTPQMHNNRDDTNQTTVTTAATAAATNATAAMM